MAFLPLIEDTEERRLRHATDLQKQLNSLELQK